MLLLLLGCDTLSATWIDQRPACDAEPYGWADDLLSWVADGPGDGSFGLDPDDEPRIGVNGEYDPGTGAFAWDVTYDPDYWMTSVSVRDGKGTVWHNGDLDIEYVAHGEDILGEEWAGGHRVVRAGCAETRWEWDADADDPTYVEYNGTWSDESFDWTVDADGVDTWSGSMASDLTRTTDYRDATYETHRVTYPDGTADNDFEQVDGDYTFEGSQHTEFDGSYSAEYDIVENGKTTCTVESERDYSGEGTDHYECGKEEFDCDYTVTKKGVCTYECTDGSSGDC